jgi:hypothetical protein
MATKTQDFRFENVRPKEKAPQPKKLTRRQRRTHNDAERLDGKKTYALETMGAHASRKSTRGGANRSKPDSAQRITARIASERPSARTTQRRQ